MNTLGDRTQFFYVHCYWEPPTSNYSHPITWIPGYTMRYGFWFGKLLLRKSVWRDIKSLLKTVSLLSRWLLSTIFRVFHLNRTEDLQTHMPGKAKWTKEGLHITEKFFNPNQTGLFAQSKDRGGGESPRRFIKVLWPQFSSNFTKNGLKGLLA